MVISGGKIGFNVRSMPSQDRFALPVLKNILHHFFAWAFYHSNWLSILKGYIIRIKTTTKINISVYLHEENWMYHVMQK